MFVVNYYFRTLKIKKFSPNKVETISYYTLHFHDEEGLLTYKTKD